MDDKRSPRKKGATIIAAVLLFLLTAVYVLSIGPAMWLYGTERVSAASINSFYAPVIWCSAKSDITTIGLERYSGHFARLGFRQHDRDLRRQQEQRSEELRQLKIYQEDRDRKENDALKYRDLLSKQAKPDR